MIRLRSGIITTTEIRPTDRDQKSLEDNAPVSGLYIFQFRAKVQSSWRDLLNGMGVELISYLPDDAYIVRLNQADLKSLQSLPMLQFVGPYRPNYKIQSRLKKMGEEKPIAIRLIVLPDTKVEEYSQLPLISIQKVAPYAFGLVIDAQMAPNKLMALAESPKVLWIERASPVKLYDEVAVKIVGGPNTNSHMAAVQEAGFKGKGVVVAVADSGLYGGTLESLPLNLTNRVNAFMPYGSLPTAADENGHGTHISGIIADNGALGETDESGALYGLGMAPESHLVIQRVFNDLGAFVLTEASDASYSTLTQDAVRAGADIGSNSWGSDTQDTLGQYDTRAMEFDALTRDADTEAPGDQPYILEFSAGNDGLAGAQTIGSPAVAKNVIATGASQNDRRQFFSYQNGPEALADFSSRGPCEDGRIKPDLVAPGTWIASLRSSAAPNDVSGTVISDNYKYENGTSQAGAMVSGAAAVFVQYYRQNHTNATPSPAMVKAALINLATDLGAATGTLSAPDNDQGWGRVNIAPIADSSRQFFWLDQTTPLATGETYEKQILVSDAKLPLRITMAYTDVPGTPSAIPALVNDLDLEVVAPNGKVYLGNQFSNGDSISDASTPDNINNVESVHILTPVPGQYTVRVRARNVVEDARRDTVPIDQDFALAISGTLAQPGYGIITLDRNVYTTASAIQLSVIDSDLAGQPSVKVQISSTTQKDGLALTLLAANSTGLFTGSVFTARAPAANDGLLHLAQGDAIHANYQDASPSGERAASAMADLQPPVISGIHNTNRQGFATVFWQTDKLTSGTIYYGTNQASPSTFQTATQGNLTLYHQFTLPQLASGSTVYYWVVSTDAAGNSTTNNNQGQWYSFIAPLRSVVLLVNAYQSDTNSPEDGNTPNLPLSGYTDALEAAQVSYQIWDLNTEGRSPTSTELSPYRAVIWRINDSYFIQKNSISDADQATLQKYVQSGGAFFMASMELLFRIDTNGPFMTNVLHVQSCELDTGASSISGIPSDPVGSGVQTNLDFSLFPYAPDLGVPSPDLSDSISPTTNATAFLLNNDRTTVDGPQAIGVRYPITGEDSIGRTVFLSIPLEAIPASGDDPNNRASILRRIVGFLIPDLNGSKSIALNKGVYTIPSRVIVEVTDSSRVGTNHVTAKFYSDVDTNGVWLSLNKTLIEGMFRGEITLVDATNIPINGELRVQNGSTIRAEYIDGSSAGGVQATAMVDTVVPVISGVSPRSDYQSAYIEWNTFNKPTDALVQYGENALLGSAAYISDRANSHVVTLNGLTPRRKYYYKVVSTDAAGNKAIDDNNGFLYTFQTLTPLYPPWMDDMENGPNEFDPNDWQVATDSNSSANWLLGLPQYSEDSTAHSGTNAWGSNLDGNFISTGNTRLISPAVYLTGGNSISLSFWQSYSFFPSSDSVTYESGQVQISTNNGSSPWIKLSDVIGTSDGWERKTIDLSGYAGQMVWIGWWYLLAGDNMHHPGWLVDDISITVTNAQFGNIAVTGNLSQTAFSLTGPANKSGQGWTSNFNHMPCGEYVITFQPVTHYDTPAPRTNVLTVGQTLLFKGNYTFADTNNNGIPDSWEMQYFGTVSASHPPETDTDGDGASDYAEFIAGTDPTNPHSRLFLSVTNSISNGTNQWQFQWPSVVGRSYRLWTSSNAVNWTMAFDWRRATGQQTNVPFTPSNSPALFRLEVSP